MNIVEIGSGADGGGAVWATVAHSDSSLYRFQSDILINKHYFVLTPTTFYAGDDSILGGYCIDGLYVPVKTYSYSTTLSFDINSGTISVSVAQQSRYKFRSTHWFVLAASTAKAFTQTLSELGGAGLNCLSISTILDDYPSYQGGERYWLIA